jgi:hypothetical protein
VSHKDAHFQPFNSTEKSWTKVPHKVEKEERKKGSFTDGHKKEIEKR